VSFLISRRSCPNRVREPAALPSQICLIVANLGPPVAQSLQVIDDDDECSICRETVSRVDITAVRPCGHAAFCERGITSWLSRNSSCPIFRADVSGTRTETGTVTCWPNGVPGNDLNFYSNQCQPHEVNPNRSFPGSNNQDVWPQHVSASEFVSPPGINIPFTLRMEDRDYHRAAAAS
jgi:hypothetical protein